MDEEFYTVLETYENGNLINLPVSIRIHTPIVDLNFQTKYDFIRGSLTSAFSHYNKDEYWNEQKGSLKKIDNFRFFK